MPKGGKYVNEKAEAARSRKDEAKSAAKEKASKDQEDAYWRAAGEGEKSKAQAKKDEQDRQRAEAAAKKAEARRLAEEEEAALSKPKQPAKAKVAGPKVTQHELGKHRELDEAARATAAQQRQLAARREVSEESYAALVDTENVNRQEDAVSASGVEQAIGALASAGISSSPAPAEDKHPEKRMRAAWLAFEERNLPLLKMEKPGLKQSQYREMLWTKWQRSPDNPINKSKLAAA